MKLLMHILSENKNLKIDNKTINVLEIRKKLFEEFGEVVQAITNYSTDRTLSNLKEVIRETFDLIQMCILVLWKCHTQALNFKENNLVQEINIEHKNKLMDRGWTIQTGIEIDVKE